MKFLALVVLVGCTIEIRADEDADRLAAAKTALRSGDYGKVLERLAPLLNRDSAKDENAAVARQLAASALYQRGVEHFRNARIAESVSDFDREIQLSPGSAPGHWQRGIALYYAGEYAKGVKQFELHQTVNPQDVENAAWHFLCAVRAPGGALEKARKGLIPITGDARIPMRQVQGLFAGTATTDDVWKAAEGGGPSARFYADLYVGLYYEAIGKNDESLRLLRKAAENPSGKSNYMGDVARVHVKLRTSSPTKKSAEK